MWLFTKRPAKLELLAVISLTLLVLTSCGGEVRHAEAGIPSSEAGSHLVGPGDSLQIFVLDHPDLSTAVAVRSDGKISIPLVDDMQAAGKSPTQLARDIEGVLGTYVRTPVVTVIVQGFVGQQIRVVCQAVKPSTVQYRQGLTVLDYMIEAGCWSECARKIDQNFQLLPGDVIITPHSGDNAIIILRSGDVIIPKQKSLLGDVIITPHSGDAIIIPR
jgi:polysaccharide export outer membrane protein